jgi:hypothetical protein
MRSCTKPQRQLLVENVALGFISVCRLEADIKVSATRKTEELTPKSTTHASSVAVGRVLVEREREEIKFTRLH